MGSKFYDTSEWNYELILTQCLFKLPYGQLINDDDYILKMMMLGTGTKIYNFGRRGGEFESCVDSWITVGQGYFLVS